MDLKLHLSSYNKSLTNIPLSIINTFSDQES